MNKFTPSKHASAIRTLNEYAAEDSIVASRLFDFLHYAKIGDVSGMVRHKDALNQFAACGHGIDELLAELESI